MTINLKAKIILKNRTLIYDRYSFKKGVNIIRSTPEKNVEQPLSTEMENKNKKFFEDMFVGNVEVKPDKQNVEILKSPTGSGKSYAMLECAIRDASNGGIAVIAYPNLNLLNENVLFLKERVPKEYNIEILEVTMNEYLSGITGTGILESLSKGRLIVLTLHTYITQRGDWGNYSTFFMLLQSFKSITSIYVDEAHLLFSSYQKNYPLTFLLYEDLGSYKIITSGFLLQDAIKKNKKIFISPQGLTATHMIKPREANQKLAVKVSTPQDTYELNSGVSFISDTAMRVSFSNLPDLKPGSDPNIYKNSEVNQIQHLQSNSMFLKLPDTIRNELLAVNKTVGGLFFRLEDLKPVTDNGMLLNSKYYDLFYLSITGDIQKDSQIKTFLTKYYHLFFNYNTYITIMRMAFPNFDKNILRSAHSSEGINTVSLQNQIITYNTDLLTRIVDSFRTAYDNIDEITDLLRKDITSLSYDFLQIYLKKYGNGIHDPSKGIEYIYPETPVEALSMTYCLSTNTYLLNSKPLYINKDGEPGNNVTLSSFEEYKDAVILISKNQNENDSVNNESDSVDNESDSKSDVVDDNKNKTTPSKSKKASLVYMKGSPFTSEFVCTFVGDFHKYKNFKSVKFFSATYSNPTLMSIKTSVDNIKFTEFATERKKLNKLVLIKSQIDWFTNNALEWKKNWKEFADFFYKTFSEGLPIGQRKFGLFLAPSNKDADNFIRYRIPKPDDRYSLVTGSDESYIDFSSDDKSLKEKIPFSTKPTKIENRVIRVSSILSTVSVGLNMPEHSFILASANSYKPVSVVWRYGDIPLTDARNYETMLALIQAIGRNARHSALELEDNLYTARCALISKSDVFPNTIETLAEYSTKFYEQVEVVDICPLETLLGGIRSNTRSFSCYKQLSKLKDLDEDLYLNIFPFGSFEYSQDIRFSLLKNLLLSIKDQNIKNETTMGIYIEFIYKYKIIAGCAELSLLLAQHLAKINWPSKDLNNEQQSEQINDGVNNTKSNFKGKKISKSFLYRFFNMQRLSEYEKVAYETICGIFIPYYNNVMSSEQAYKAEFCNTSDNDHFIFIFIKLFKPFLTETIFNKEAFKILFAQSPTSPNESKVDNEQTLSNDEDANES